MPTPRPANSIRASKNISKPEFKGGDGAAPYVKSSYARSTTRRPDDPKHAFSREEYIERDGWGELTGYLERSLLPDGIPAGMRGLRQL